MVGTAHANQLWTMQEGLAEGKATRGMLKPPQARPLLHLGRANRDGRGPCWEEGLSVRRALRMGGGAQCRWEGWGRAGRNLSSSGGVGG